MKRSEKIKIGDLLFKYSTKNTFICKFEGCSFGATDGKPFTDSRFRDVEAARAYFRANRLLSLSMVERIERFVDLMENENWESCISNDSLQKFWIKGQ